MTPALVVVVKSIKSAVAKEGSVRKLFYILCLGLFLTACEETRFEGELTVDRDIAVKEGRKNQAITAGTYQAVAKVQSKKIELELREGDRLQKVRLKTRRKLDVPENGSFEISARELRQGFGLSGEVRTVRTKSSVLATERQVCTVHNDPCPPPDFPRPPGGGRLEDTVACGPTTGWQEVDYYPIHVERDIEVSFVSSKGDSLGEYQGAGTSLEKDIVRVGPCW